MPGKASAPPFYRVTFQLLTVVFDIVGYVAETDFLDIDPGDDLKRAMRDRDRQGLAAGRRHPGICASPC